jgi:D-3-phosphoglycerate dehydrogenase
MARIKTALTAVFSGKYLAELEEICEIRKGGHCATGIIMGEEEMLPFAKDAEILIVEFEEVSKKIIDNCPYLRLIACTRGNPINIDCKAALERKIPVLYTPGRNANAVAEFIVGGMISLCRNMGRANHEIRNGRYLGKPAGDVYKPSDKDDLVWLIEEKDSPYTEYKGFEISGKTLGFVGFGAIGARTSELLSGFNMQFIVYDPYLAPETAKKYKVKPAGLNEVFSQSDFVSINCKVTGETTGMIGREQFDRMKKGAYLINTARGKIIKQKDFVDSMRDGKIAGAVLDVFWQEPLPGNHPLLEMPNVLITPHIAGASHDVVTGYSRVILDDIRNYAQNKTLVNVFKLF